MECKGQTLRTELETNLSKVKVEKDGKETYNLCGFEQAITLTVVNKCYYCDKCSILNYLETYDITKFDFKSLELEKEYILKFDDNGNLILIKEDGN